MKVLCARFADINIIGLRILETPSKFTPAKYLYIRLNMSD